MNGVGLGGQIFIGYRSVLVQFRVVRKFVRFCLKSLDLARPDRILMRSQWISKRSGWILARSGWILMRSRHISKRLGWILTRSYLISSSSGWILTDWTENTDEPLLLMVNGNFPVSIQLGRLKIGFSASNLPTDLPFSGSGGRDPPPTVTDVRSVGRSLSRIGQIGQVSWVPVLFGHPNPLALPCKMHSPLDRGFYMESPLI